MLAGAPERTPGADDSGLLAIRAELSVVTGQFGVCPVFVSATIRERLAAVKGGALKWRYAMDDTRRPSYRLTFQDAVRVWMMHLAGHFQNRIASMFDVNPGRVNEVIKGTRHPGSESEARRLWNGA
jgi:hypothetical protein